MLNSSIVRFAVRGDIDMHRRTDAQSRVLPVIPSRGRALRGLDSEVVLARPRVRCSSWDKNLDRTRGAGEHHRSRLGSIVRVSTPPSQLRFGMRPLAVHIKLVLQ
jgi:hypothetical protein